MCIAESGSIFGAWENVKFPLGFYCVISSNLKKLPWQQGHSTALRKSFHFRIHTCLTSLNENKSKLQKSWKFKLTPLQALLSYFRDLLNWLGEFQTSAVSDIQVASQDSHGAKLQSSAVVRWVDFVFHKTGPGFPVRVGDTNPNFLFFRGRGGLLKAPAYYLLEFPWNCIKVQRLCAPQIRQCIKNSKVTSYWQATNRRLREDWNFLKGSVTLNLC